LISPALCRPHLIVQKKKRKNNSVPGNGNGGRLCSWAADKRCSHLESCTAAALYTRSTTVV
jgi:hypothetical protein